MIEPDVSIEPGKGESESPIYPVITVVNHLSHRIVVFVKSGVPPSNIKLTPQMLFDAIIVKGPRNSRKSIDGRVGQQPPTSANFDVVGQLGYLIIFVAINEDNQPLRYIQMLSRRIQNESRFNVLPRHYEAAIQTETNRFNEHFQLVANNDAVQPLINELNYTSPDQEEQEDIK
ncbi:hypothetical protein DFA_06941 [Cavenderia fasciculata]|uniref:Uncharacterized protein n=1 Tax=Cavenderia fasciculata TaxID=261658 RepID=F4PX36_CACFS|nr:uncharacterized protein DFA_06941 [Cavenderia fasciculata]EGG19839.1 hypothetical protein DFA_06941 [Cavenderia fasciculata]|eukprot:XP_004358185.1 hypothetical protein DFA_06941 [Cavenderia fasciculata]